MALKLKKGSPKEPYRYSLYSLKCQSKEVFMTTTRYKVESLVAWCLIFLAGSQK